MVVSDAADEFDGESAAIVFDFSFMKTEMKRY